MGDGFYNGAARRAGSPDLKMPEPTKNTVHTELHHQAASAGVATHRGKVDDRQAAEGAGFNHQLIGSTQVLGKSHQFFFRKILQPADLTQNGAAWPDSFDHVAGSASLWYGS